MRLYGSHKNSLPQKITILVLESFILVLSCSLLLGSGFKFVNNTFGFNISPGDFTGRMIIFFFNCVVYIRMWITITYLLKRSIPWEEAFSVPFAFALYYLGFAALGYSSAEGLDLIGASGILLFLAGSFLNTFSELQRNKWKKAPRNKGRLYTGGLFHYSMHINYFGDLLWVAGYALVTHNIYSWIIVIMIFCFFTFYNIPKLDKYLAEKYGADFKEFSRSTKKFIPFIY